MLFLVPGRQGGRAWPLAMGSPALPPLSPCLWGELQLCFRVKGASLLVPHWDQAEPRNLGSSAERNSRPLPSLRIMLRLLMLNANVQNTVFFRKGCNFLVIGKLWSPCTCFAYQVIFQCRGLFCFSLPSHCRFKSCSWHQGRTREAVPTAGTGAETARCLPGTKSYFLSISTPLSSWGCVRACLQGHHGLAVACSSRKVTFPLLLQGKESRHGHQGMACGLAVAVWDRLTCRGSISVAAAVG